MMPWTPKEEAVKTMPTLTINDIEVGMQFRSLSPVFRGDNIGFPADEEFPISWNSPNGDITSAEILKIAVFRG